MTAVRGKFVWCELMTSDLKAAQTFYKNVVGWTMSDAGLASHPYTILSAGETPLGGMMAMPQEVCDRGANPGWVGYIGVDDVDAFAAKVKSAGGAVLRAAEDLPGVGRFAVVADPHGAAFVLFKSAGFEPPAPASSCTPGLVGWRELQAGNLDEAWDFYAGLFGWTKTMAVDMVPMGTYQTFATGSDAVGGMMTKMPEAPHPFWLYYFYVDAVEAAMARVKDNGGQVLFGPQEVPGGAWIAQALDPQGALFAMVGPRQ